MFKGNIGTRTGRNVLEGKEIHCDSAGFDNFEDYFTDSASSSPEKTSLETVRQNAIKSFLNAEKTVQDGESPLSKLPSKKRLSFKADATSDSDSSSITCFQPRNRLISKRGMQSFPGEDEEEEKKNLGRFSPLALPVKKSPSPSNKVYLPHPHSETKYTKRISKRGMKSFPDDDVDDDLQVYEIVNSPDYLNVEPIIVEKMVGDEQKNLSPNGGKENEENLGKIQNYENTKQLHQKSYSHVSPSSIKVNPKPGEKTAKSMPVKNWYIWEDNSLTDRAKIIITPYGVHEDTSIKNNFQTMGTNLQVIDEDESQPPYKKNWKSKLPNLDICENSNVESSESACEKETAQEKTKSTRGKQTTNQRKSIVPQTVKKVQGLPFSRLSLPVNEKHRDNLSEAEVSSVVEEELSEINLVMTDEVISVDEKSLPKSGGRSETEESSKNDVLSSDVATSINEERQKLKAKRKVAVPKLRVSPRKQRTSLRTKKPSPKKKRSLGSVSSKSTPEEKRKSTTSSTKNKQALPVSKKNLSLSQKKKSSLSKVKKTISNLRKSRVSSSQENKPVETRKRKRAASRSPEIKVPAKRAKTNEPTTRTSNHWTRSSSKVKKESISPAKKQKKITPQKPNEVDTNSEQHLSVSPPNIIMPLPSINSSESTQDMPDNHSLLQSETENSEAISLGFNYPPSNFSRKDADLSSKRLDKFNSSTNSNDKIDILKVFDSKELNPKLDKTNEKNKKISSLSQSNTEDEPKLPLQKHEKKKRSSTTLVPLPRRRRTSGPLSSEDSLVICNKEKRRSGRLCAEDSLVAFSQGYSKTVSAEKSKSPAKTNHVLKDLNVSKSHEGPPDWLCQGCNGLIPQCLMTCIFCGFRRQESHKEDPNESDSDSQEGTTDWQCQGCEGLIPVSLEACIFCGLCKQEGSQGAETQMSQHRNSPSSYYRKLFKQLRGKNKKHSPQKLKKNSMKGQKALSEPVGATSKYESPALQNTSMKKQSSFSLKSNYKFKSYTDIKVDHKISYCVCSQSDTAMVGMMKLQRGGYRNPNQSLKEMFFTVLKGQVRVQIDSEKQEMDIHDTFVVAKNGEYSIENTSAQTACLIFTIIK